MQLATQSSDAFGLIALLLCVVSQCKSLFDRKDLQLDIFKESHQVASLDFVIDSRNSNPKTMSYDPKVFELGWDFILAGERYRVLDMEKIPAKDQHEMCGLFKQSTFGDIDIKYDGTQGTVFNNMTAWSNCRGMSKVDAIKRYVTMANQLVEAYNK